MTKRQLQAAAAHAEQAQRGEHVVRPAAQGIGIGESPFLTVAEAARFLRFDARAKDPEKALRDWAAAHGIPARRCGRVLLFERRVLEAALSLA
jgi:hypothetical protein